MPARRDIVNPPGPGSAQPAIDWALWRTFLAALQAGSLAGAARRLGLTHPTVRRQLITLERALGHPLFTRSPSGLLATELAEALRPAAEAMAAAAGQLGRTAGASRDRVAGTVRISASEIMAIEVLPALIAPLRARHPALRIELAATNHQDDILRRDADVAVRMTAPTQLDLLARRIGAVELGLYAHRRLLDEPGARERRTVADWPLVGQDRDSRLLDALREAGHPVPRDAVVLRSDSDPVQLAGIRAGLGAGVVQRPIAERSGELVRIFPALKSSLEIWLVAHADLRTLPRQRAVLDHLHEALGAWLSGG